MLWQDSQSSTNRYAKSELGQQLKVISLCEVGNVQKVKSVVLRRKETETKDIELKGLLADHGQIMTLMMEQACVVRFLMAEGQFACDVYSSPPQKVPTLNEVLEFQARTGEK
jgi:hypothetical protein